MLVAMCTQTAGGAEGSNRGLPVMLLPPPPLLPQLLLPVPPSTGACPGKPRGQQAAASSLLNFTLVCG